MLKLEIEIEWLLGNEDLAALTKGTTGSAGFDLPAAIENNLTIEPLSYKLIPLGFKLAIPNGYEGQIRPKSGLAFKSGITVLNSPGTIDSDYRGEVKAILMNLGKNDFILNRGDRIAQLVISAIPDVSFIKKESLHNTKRSSGGFGSTGI